MDGEERVHENHKDMEPAAVVGKLLIFECSSVEELAHESFEVLTFSWGLRVSKEQVHSQGHDNRHRGKVECQIKESSLKKEVEITIVAAMGDPILHFQLLNKLSVHIQKNAEGLGLGKQTFAVDLLDQNVPIDREFSWLGLKKRFLTAELVKPEFFPTPES